MGLAVDRRVASGAVGRFGQGGATDTGKEPSRANEIRRGDVIGVIVGGVRAEKQLGAAPANVGCDMATRVDVVDDGP